MKKSSLFICAAVAGLGACTHINIEEPRFPASSAPDFVQYVHQYVNPQYYQSNSTAFEARLKLIDYTPAGGSLKIATFTVDNGPVVRQLARHLCLAAQRGVKVELLADSKSGDKAGIPNPFNIGEDT